MLATGDQNVMPVAAPPLSCANAPNPHSAFRTTMSTAER